MGLQPRFRFPTAADDGKVWAYDHGTGFSELVPAAEVVITSSLPTASSTLRGRIRIVEAVGQPDRAYVCKRLANNTYDWVEI